MEKQLIVVITAVCLMGCQSGMYKISTSEDDKSLGAQIDYTEVDSLPRNDYDSNQMPVEVIEGEIQKKHEEDGLSVVLCFFSLGIFPWFESSYETQDIEIKTPIGKKRGTWRIDAKQWTGWLPIFIGYPGIADERTPFPYLGNERMEQKAKSRLVDSLVRQFSHENYVAFAKTKKEERDAEVARIKAVSEKVDGLIAKDQFDDAYTLIDNESKPHSATRECDKDAWAAMRTRVSAANRVFDEKHAKVLIAAGNYEEAIEFCKEADEFTKCGNSLSAFENVGLRHEAISKAVSELNDGDRLISLFKLVKEVDARDDIVLKLKKLNMLSKLTTEQIVDIANTSRRDEVVLALIESIDDKDVLAKFLDSKLISAFHDPKLTVLKTLLNKIADADLVRTKIWGLPNQDEDVLRAYVSIFGNDEECMKTIELYPASLTDAIAAEFKTKVSNKTIDALEEVQLNRLSSKIAKLDRSAAVARIGEIQDKSIRSKIAQKVLFRLRDCFSVTGEDLKIYRELVKMISEEDLHRIAGRIIDACADRIHFEGFYVGMTLQEFHIMERYKCASPDVKQDWSGSLYDSVYFSTDMKYLRFKRTDRYKLFEKEDGEFWSAFMRKYIPAGKKKSLGETIADAIDKGTYDYQTGYDSGLDERCYIYKSMKYGTKVIFGEESGTLVLEEYK